VKSLRKSPRLALFVTEGFKDPIRIKEKGNESSRDELIAK
jgi:hypothetical protein